MGVGELAAALREEAEKEERSILSAAEARAKEIWDEANERCAKLEREARRTEESRRAAAKAFEEGYKNIADRRRRAAAELRYAQAIYGKCRARYAAFMRTPPYAEFITALFRQAEGELGNTELVEADPVTAAILRAARKDLKVTESENIGLGFAAVGMGGKMRIIGTFEVRYEKIWRGEAPRIMRQVAEAVTDGL